MTATREDLVRLYSLEGLPLNEIGRMFKVTGACISKYVKRYDLRREVAA